MKKYFLMAVCIIIMSISASAVSVNKVLLDHNGQVTTFDDIQSAINASADGDVIYLTLGTFKVSTLNITKEITIRGTGDTSIINGEVKISIAGTPTLESPLLEALAVSGGVTISSAMNNLCLKNSKISGTLAINGAVNGGSIEKCEIEVMTFGDTIDNLYIDRSSVTGTLTLSSSIKGMTVINSKLNAVSANSGATGNTTFVNCEFILLYTNNFAATIVNSIIYLSKHSISSTVSSSINSSVLLNTLLRSGYVYVGTSSVTQGCYYDTNSGFSKSKLQEKGYLGTDGTVVGIYGGSTPYSDAKMFTPSAPKVTSSKLNLDAEKKELNVNLTVSPE